MCGIIGLLVPRASLSDEALARRASVAEAALAHRGPDGAGTWTDAAAGIALGHRRLSIIDLSAAARQPMVSANGRYVLSFNGEIYNFASMRARLEERGIALRTRSDTEVLLESITMSGLESVLGAANGMYAFALWDRQTRTLRLVRDRFGQKPVYYGWAGGAFVFGSELKALRTMPGFDASVDPAAVGLLMRFAMIPAPHTIHTGCLKLPAGTILEVDARAVETRQLPEPIPYWSADAVAAAGAEDPLDLPESEAVESLDRALRDAVGACMVADVPLGAFLSGGIDSATVVAQMQAQSTRPVKTFSIGFAEADYDEAAAAAAVARHLGTQHTALTVTAYDAQAVIPDLPAIYDEPFADSSQIPTFLVSRLAREHVTVSLSGDGGDEVFGGYNRYTWASRLARILTPAPTGVRRTLRLGLESLPPARWDAIAALAPARLRPARFGDKVHKLAEIVDAPDFAAIYARLISQWKDPARAVPGVALPHSIADDNIRWPVMSSRSEQMMVLDALTYLPDDILVKLDRASMAVSLETRVPYLDHRLYTLAWRLPLAMKIRGGTRKWILREVLARYVPRPLFERPKMGFGVPIGDWLRQDLREWAENLLAPSDLDDAGVLDVTAIRAVWAEHLSGERNHQYLLWPVLMLQAWRKAMPAALTDHAAGCAR